MKNKNRIESQLVKTGFALGLGVMFAACSGAPVEKVEVEKPQFKVIDAAPGGREAWLDNPNLYAKKEGLDTDKYMYFTGDAKSADKRGACEDASANITDDVARQVSVFVNSSIARASTGSTSEDTTGISAASASSTETSRLSSQLSKVQFAGIEKYKQYWEQRDYSQVGGGKSLYYCWVLGKVDKQTISQAIERAKSFRFQDDPALKEKVESKLVNLQKDFENYMQSH